MSLETQIKEKLDEIFQNKKCLPAGEFWKRMEEHIKDFGKDEIDGEVYRTIAGLYSLGVLDLREGCYIKK